MKSEIVSFTDGDVNIEVQINPEQVAKRIANIHLTRLCAQ